MVYKKLCQLLCTNFLSPVTRCKSISSWPLLLCCYHQLWDKWCTAHLVLTTPKHSNAPGDTIITSMSSLPFTAVVPVLRGLRTLTAVTWLVCSRLLTVASMKLGILVFIPHSVHSHPSCMPNVRCLQLVEVGPSFCSGM